MCNISRPTDQASVSHKICTKIRQQQGDSSRYWDFKNSLKESFEDSLFQYPAMMVPALQRQVIAAVLTSRPEIDCITDPFLGSGTILIQAMLAGKSFIGQDINPLAILISKTRAFSLDHVELRRSAGAARSRVQADTSTEYAIRFKNQSKWFTRGANIGLSRLHRAIQTEPLWRNRLFLWTCLAETVRNNSNSRTSTFKLHIRPHADQNTTTEQVIDFFFRTVDANLTKVRTFADALRNKNLIAEHGGYIKTVAIVYGDSTVSSPDAHLAHSTGYELVVTSPPYGDNRTTVPYGQAAWLPLQWITLNDIDENIPGHVIRSMYEIDNQSLGGRRTRQSKVLAAQLKSFGPATRRMITALGRSDGDGLSRFVHFIRDLDRAVHAISANASANCHMIWTLGHRWINGVKCPLTDIVSELCQRRKAVEVARIHRRIPTKRIPSKNSVSKTINEEFILILHSEGNPG